jgi:3-oxoadipate enol-lactonase
MMDADMFAGQIDELSKRHRVLAIDPPGHGESAPLDRIISLDECGDALVAVLRVCGEPSAIVAGNSWGGMVAINVAARHPAKAQAIVVMNAAATPVSMGHRIQYGLMPSLVRLLGIASPLIAVATRSFLGATAYRQRSELRRFISDKLDSLDHRNVIHVVNSILLGRCDQRPLLSHIKCPTLIIGGLEDRVFGPSEQAVMHEGIAGSRLVMVSAGHFAPLEAADEVTEAVAEFAATCELR